MFLLIFLVLLVCLGILEYVYYFFSVHYMLCFILSLF